MSTDLKVAETIRKQMGGSRLTAMTGAKDFVATSRSLSFRIPNHKEINHVQITLNETDLYNVTFGKLGRGGEYKVVYRAEDVFADNLQALFTDRTGLRLSL